MSWSGDKNIRQYGLLGRHGSAASWTKARAKHEGRKSGPSHFGPAAQKDKRGQILPPPPLTSPEQREGTELGARDKGRGAAGQWGGQRDKTEGLVGPHPL